MRPDINGSSRLLSCKSAPGRFAGLARGSCCCRVNAFGSCLGSRAGSQRSGAVRSTAVLSIPVPYPSLRCAHPSLCCIHPCALPIPALHSWYAVPTHPCTVSILPCTVPVLPCTVPVPALFPSLCCAHPCLVPVLCCVPPPSIPVLCPSLHFGHPCAVPIHPFAVIVLYCAIPVL